MRRWLPMRLPRRLWNELAFEFLWKVANEERKRGELTSGGRTCTVVVGIEHGKESADHKDVGVLVQHLDELKSKRMEIELRLMLDTGYI